MSFLYESTKDFTVSTSPKINQTVDQVYPRARPFLANQPKKFFPRLLSRKSTSSKNRRITNLWNKRFRLSQKSTGRDTWGRKSAIKKRDHARKWNCERERLLMSVPPSNLQSETISDHFSEPIARQMRWPRALNRLSTLFPEGKRSPTAVTWLFAQPLPICRKKSHGETFLATEKGCVPKCRKSWRQEGRGFFRGFSKETSEETSFSVSKRSSRINASNANFFSWSFFPREMRTICCNLRCEWVILRSNWINQEIIEKFWDTWGY